MVFPEITASSQWSAWDLSALNRQIVSHYPVNDTLGGLHPDAMPVSAKAQCHSYPFTNPELDSWARKYGVFLKGLSVTRRGTSRYQYRFARRPNVLAPNRASGLVVSISPSINVSIVRI
jgi:hypothetical protein